MVAYLRQSREERIISQFGSRFVTTLPDVREGGSVTWYQHSEGSSAGGDSKSKRKSFSIVTGLSKLC